jgi:Ion channel
MTCMSTVGFGNIAAFTDSEKIFSVCMMVISGRLDPPLPAVILLY